MTSNNNVFMVFPRLGRRWLGSSAQHKPETSEGRTQMEQEKEGTCALWLFVSPKSSAPGIFPIAKISEPPKSRTCPSHLPFCQKGIFESYVMCLVSGRFCTYPTLCHLPLIYSPIRLTYIDMRLFDGNLLQSFQRCNAWMQCAELKVMKKDVVFQRSLVNHQMGHPQNSYVSLLQGILKYGKKHGKTMLLMWNKMNKCAHSGCIHTCDM